MDVQSLCCILEGDPAGLPSHLERSKVAALLSGVRAARCLSASLEVRFFFDSRAIGSIARRKNAPKRTRDTHSGGCPDVDRGDRIVSLPARRQYSSSIAPSFVEAVAGRRDVTPDPKHIALAEELPRAPGDRRGSGPVESAWTAGEQPDFVVASWGPAIRVCPSRRPRLAPQPATDRPRARVFAIGGPGITSN